MPCALERPTAFGTSPALPGTIIFSNVFLPPELRPADLGTRAKCQFASSQIDPILDAGCCTGADWQGEGPPPAATLWPGLGGECSLCVCVRARAQAQGWGVRGWGWPGPSSQRVMWASGRRPHSSQLPFPPKSQAWSSKAVSGDTVPVATLVCNLHNNPCFIFEYHENFERLERNSVWSRGFRDSQHSAEECVTLRWCSWSEWPWRGEI